jgi:hypothetical protein
MDGCGLVRCDFGAGETAPSSVPFFPCESQISSLVPSDLCSILSLAKARRLECPLDTTLGPIELRLPHLPYVACVERYLHAASLGPCISQ